MTDETLVEDGIVRAVERDGTVVVVVSRQASCGSCAARGACLTFGPSERVLRVPRVQAGPEPRPGDRVTLEIRAATFLRASLLGYLVPTLAFFAGIGAVYLLMGEGSTFLGLDREVAAFALGAAGVAATFGGLWIAGSRPGARSRYTPRIRAVHGSGRA